MQFLSRLEANGFAGSDRDFGAGPGIPSNPRFARAKREHAEAAQFDPVIGGEGFLERAEYRVHGSFCFRPGETGFLYHLVNDVLLDHESFSALMRPI